MLAADEGTGHGLEPLGAWHGSLACPSCECLRYRLCCSSPTTTMHLPPQDMLPSSTLAKQLLGITPGERREEAMHRQK